MKAKYKKFLIICGKALMLLCLTAFVLVCVFYYASPKDEAQTIRTKAEEAAPTAETSRPIYPSENLFSYPYFSKSFTSNGLTYTDNGDGTITVNGTATDYSAFYINGNIRLNGEFTVSGIPVGAELVYTVTLYDLSGAAVKSITDTVITFNTADYVKYSSFVVSVKRKNNDRLIDNVVVKPMLNIGNIAYPYIPNLDNIRQEGYDEGYKDASDTLNLGVLYGATASGKFIYTNGQTVTLSNGKPDFSYNGLNFNSIWGKYYHYNGDTENTLESAEMTLNFKTSFQYDGFPLYFLGDSDVMSATFISTTNKRYNANIEKYNETAIGQDYALIRIRDAEKEEGIEVKALTIYFGRATDTLYNANVLSMSGGFLNGYDNGYNEGFSNGHTNGVLDGRQEGYDNGYNEGYSKGKTDALSQLSDEPLSQSIRGFIFSLFDAPVSTFLNTFNLSYDGFDLGALVAFIFTGIVVIAVVRLLT